MGMGLCLIERNALLELYVGHGKRKEEMEWRKRKWERKWLIEREIDINIV